MLREIIQGSTYRQMVRFGMLCVIFIVIATAPMASSKEVSIVGAKAKGVKMDAFTADCEDCKKVEKEVFKPLKDAGAVIIYHDTADPKTGKVLADIERLPEFRNAELDMSGELPLIFVGNDVIEGDSIAVDISAILSRGDPSLFMAPSERARQLMEEARRGGAPRETGVIINVAFFDSSGCRHCSTAGLLLDVISAKNPAAKITRFDCVRSENKLLLEEVGRLKGVPVDKRLLTPAVFVGDDYLVKDVSQSALARMIEKHRASGAPAFWEGIDRGRAESDVLKRFRSFGLSGIVAAGLIDGINPCAFATIVFMVIYLSAMKMSSRRVLAAGMIFSAAVYLTYFAMGAGALAFLSTVTLSKSIRMVVLAAGALAAIILGVISFIDYRTMSGGGKGVVLRLSQSAQVGIRVRITRFARSKWMLPGAFFVGVTISATEAVCTGQIYLPTILVVAQASKTRMAGLKALAIYNMAFLVPLLVVFLSIYFGVGADAVGRFTTKHLAKAKLMMAVFLFLTGGVLFLLLI